MTCRTGETLGVATAAGGAIALAENAASIKAGALPMPGSGSERAK